MTYVLTIGDRAYSSWSLRGWLLMKLSGAAFETRLIPMYDPAFQAMQAEIAPGRTVPNIRFGDALVWDSLAMAETLAEQHAGVWPADSAARGAARSLAAEMHASFRALRDRPSMNLRRRYADFAPTEAEQADANRVCELWRWARATHGAGGPYLFGAWSAADAFFAPVATRFVTYGFDLDPASNAYVDAVYAHPHFREWLADALADPRVLNRYDLDLPSDDDAHQRRAGL